ncbi:hypothetical protein [Salinarimonas ramus]|uniref:Uncharacterized protein n=1 Tax=Salinarimonas ramus TaxID=690164 RepID=A0A917QE43_9HYPH|nr:hypothetical protein [Salinarimonas ramus]GGK44674.1 hypothetical protein GCM10011322_34790 [Salinarimonas ramus]
MSALEVGAFLVRALATAGIVIGITLAVERLGARRGGMLAGLPIVLGPGFAVLALVEPAPYVTDAAGYALLSLTATQAFMLAYSAAARLGAGVASAVAAAIVAWAACAVVFGRVETVGVAPALLAFGSATLLSRAAHGRLVLPVSAVRAREGRALLLLRGALAGLLVGAVTAASARLGPALAGLLMAYPVGTTVIAATIHRRGGAALVIATLSAVTLGTTSLAAFATTLALLAEPIGAGWAFAAALVASLAVTMVMMRVAGAGRE